MDARLARPHLNDAGFATAEWAAALAMGMVVLAFALNVVMMQFARGAMQAAVDEGARAGSRLGGTLEECRDVATHRLRGDGGLLGGRLGAGVAVDCTRNGEVVGAHARGTFAWVFGVLPDQPIEVASIVVIEAAPR